MHAVCIAVPRTSKGGFRKQSNKRDQSGSSSEEMREVRQGRERSGVWGRIKREEQLLAMKRGGEGTMS